MKTEERNNAYNAVADELVKAMPNLVKGRVADKECFLVETGMNDSENHPIWATIAITVKETTPTKNHDAFNPDDAISAYNEKMQEVKEKAPAKKREPNKEYAEKMAKIEDTIRTWIIGSMDDKAFSTTEVKEAIPELAEYSLLDIGKVLTKIAKDGTTLERKKKEGKALYTKM